MQATPHTRGSTFSEHLQAPHAKGYPAYAGIDRRSKRLQISSPRLPRIRGDRPFP